MEYQYTLSQMCIYTLKAYILHNCSLFVLKLNLIGDQFLHIASLNSQMLSFFLDNTEYFFKF